MSTRAQDHTGKRFGKLTAIKHIGMDGHGRPVWHCACDCGGKKNVPSGRLVSGGTKSCGCIGRGAFGILDLAGERVGHLEVLKYSVTNGNGNACWLCRCDCGTEKVISSKSLKSGNVKSCGCKAEETRKSFRNRYKRPLRSMTYCPPASIEDLEDLVR